MVKNSHKCENEVVDMAKLIINPDREVTIEDELIERKALGLLLGYVKEAMDAKAQQEERKES